MGGQTHFQFDHPIRQPLGCLTVKNRFHFRFLCCIRGAQAERDACIHILVPKKGIPASRYNGVKFPVVLDVVEMLYNLSLNFQIGEIFVCIETACQRDGCQAAIGQPECSGVQNEIIGMIFRYFAIVEVERIKFVLCIVGISRIGRPDHRQTYKDQRKKKCENLRKSFFMDVSRDFQHRTREGSYFLKII